MFIDRIRTLKRKPGALSIHKFPICVSETDLPKGPSTLRQEDKQQGRPLLCDLCFLRVAQ